MIRILKLIFLGCVAVSLVVLAIANRGLVDVAVLPPDLAALVGWSASTQLPLFLVIFASVLVGIAVGYVLEWLREHRQRSVAKKEHRARVELEREVQALKGKAGEGQDEILALLEEPRRTG